MSRPPRFVSPRVLTDQLNNKWFRRTCSTCGDLYYIFSAVAFVDSGHCISCDNEIDTLERWFGAEQGGV